MYNTPVSRRLFLAGAATLSVSLLAPRLLSSAGATKPRLLTVICRGGLDGVSFLAPTGDPDYRNMRAGLLVERSGPNSGINLDDFYSLNPNLPTLAELFRNGDALLFHAVASPYRGRSHFDGQDVIESGYPKPNAASSGWMNRLITAMPNSVLLGQPSGVAIGTQLPLIMRGEAPVSSWLPFGFPSARDGTKHKLLDIYRHADPELAEIMEAGQRLNELVGGEKSIAKLVNQSMGQTKVAPKIRRMRQMAVTAGKLISCPDGPCIGAFDVNGFDTHFNQKPGVGQMDELLRGVNSIVDGLKESLRPVWDETVVVFITEFGRTVRMNGTAGTDHGTATVAFMIGGAVAGGRILSDWPGLRKADLFEGRDLQPTMDLRSILKGVARDHLQVPAQQPLSSLIKSL